MLCPMDSDRNKEIDAFLARENWADAQKLWLGQDASTRRYARLTKANGEKALFMDSPPQDEPPCPPNATDAERLGLGWYATARLAASRVDAFVLIADEIGALGLSTPRIFGQDVARGFCLLEDFGPHKEFSEHLALHPDEADLLYTRGVEVLAHMHQALPSTAQTLAKDGMEWPLLEFDALTAQASMDVLYDWYVPYSGATQPPESAWQAARDSVVEKVISQPRSFCFRDYHCQNLLWLPERTGLAQIGLLDFQDAIIGWDVWDLDLLLRDARREISADLRGRALAHYCALTGQEIDVVLERWAIIGTLNAIRIIGVYARLIKRDGRDHYANYMPQQIAHLKAHLAHESMAEMRAFIGQYFGELLA